MIFNDSPRGFKRPPPAWRQKVAQGGMPTDVERRQQLQLGSLGISADPSKTMAMKRKSSLSV